MGEYIEGRMRGGRRRCCKRKMGIGRRWVERMREGEKVWKICELEKIWEDDRTEDDGGRVEDAW